MKRTGLLRAAGRAARSATLPLAGLALLALLALGTPGALSAQPTSLPSPLPGLVITGYGTGSYDTYMQNGLDFGEEFDPVLAPVVLYSPADWFLFEGEVELELDLETGEMRNTVEYAQADFMPFGRVQFTAGKFLLPFGVFGERLHPTWINKLPDMPGIYGHAHGDAFDGAGALLPILNDVGFMTRFAQPMGGDWSFDLSAYVTAGPREATLDAHLDDDHAHGNLAPRFSAGHDEAAEDAAAASGFVIPALSFGSHGLTDNNDSKMLGGRLGVVRGGAFELSVSAFHAMYDDGNFLDFYGTNVSAEWKRGSLDVRGEGIVLWQEFEHDGRFVELESPGYYMQVARRIRAFEPVVRWSHRLDATVEGETARPHGREVSFGLNYWLQSSVPFKIAWNLDLDGDDSLLLQWAYGF